ncbi:hypothetical protein DFH06DRAFT_929315, partial [Mycena polygramma]
ETASGPKKNAMNARSVASDMPLHELKISPEQRAALGRMYNDSATGSLEVPVDHLFKLDADSQLEAAAIMAQHGLDLEARAHLDNRWSMHWARAGGGKKTKKVSLNETRKILLMCQCGYDHRCYQSKERHAPLPFTSCLGHAEITYVIGSQKILRIRGFFEHNQGCKDALFTRIPPIPVHPSVLAIALAQIRDGATFSDVKKKNQELFAARKY